MDDDLHDRLAGELADELTARPEPPLGDLVHNALRQGKRLRMARRIKITAAAFAAAAVFVGGFTIVSSHVATPRRLPAADTTQLTTAPLTTAPTWRYPAPVIAQPPGPKLVATLAALAARLQALLPGATFKNFTPMYGDGIPLDLQFYLDRGDGPGMVRIQIRTRSQLDPCGTDAELTCSVETGGVHVRVIGDPSNCIETSEVAVDHGNGVVVTIYISTCLQWNGRTNPPCPPALTTAGAIAVAADPAWGPLMDAALVTFADAKYPYLAKP